MHYHHKSMKLPRNSAPDAPFSHELTDEFKARSLYVDITTGAPLRIIT